MLLKTLFLNPPSFQNFDGGAGSRWPATREIESYWYPVWLAYAAGMLEGARLLDAPPHYVSAEDTIKIAQDYEFLVLFTSTPGFPGDIRLAQKIKDANPKIKVGFVGPHVSVLPEKSLKDCSAIDFVCRKEFDYSVVEYAQGKPLGLTWSCTSRVTTDYETLKAMKDDGCRLLIVGYESGDQQILKNIKKGATIERARQFTKDCHKLGLVVHGDFILGLPGETR